MSSTEGISSYVYCYKYESCSKQKVELSFREDSIIIQNHMKLYDSNCHIASYDSE